MKRTCFYPVLILGVLVAGHSNTVPDIIEALGISTPPVITANQYDNLFVVHIRHYIFRHSKLTNLKYGNPSVDFN